MSITIQQQVTIDYTFDVIMSGYRFNSSSYKLLNQSAKQVSFVVQFASEAFTDEICVNQETDKILSLTYQTKGSLVITVPMSAFDDNVDTLGISDIDQIEITIDEIEWLDNMTARTTSREEQVAIQQIKDDSRYYIIDNIFLKITDRYLHHD